MKPLDVRFWSKVDKSGGDNACWLWTARKNAYGYGTIKVGIKSSLAHRVVWNLNFGNIPERLCVCHTCDNPACVNPSHLFLGTHKQNMEDMARKGRHADFTGSKCGQAKLTEEQAIQILNAKGFSKNIAKQFGVTFSAVCRIKSGKSWPHLQKLKTPPAD